MFQNPILRGFNPDPSIVRVGEDYYIATSTFEWFPGVQIHHSKDLQNWELIARPLNRASQLDLLGVPDSCGVWAPCLSYDNGVFYLVFSNVKSFDGVWKDTPNYLVTADEISGDWSEPIFLSASGFDGSLFHDEDGRKWYTSMLSDHRKGRLFGGIILQEYDVAQRCLTGPVHHIFEGTDLGKTEGPHLYKRHDYYYLMTAEGGTEYGHAASLARSKSIIGPYVVHPDNPIISNRDYPRAIMQKCGHADLVETVDGKWYAVFLIGRPLSQHGCCTLGRESAIAEVEWRNDDWLYLKSEINYSSHDQVHRKEKIEILRQFNTPDLPIEFQSLRVPMVEDWISLKAKPGILRLYGRESLSSTHRQSLIARRVQSFHIEASTKLLFHPNSFQQMAGMVCYYNTAHWHYIYIHGGEGGKRFLQITSCDNYETQDILDPIEISDELAIQLKVRFQTEEIQFYMSENDQEWKAIGPVLDGSILSDDYVREGSERYRPAFTGSFVGICCQDLTGERCHADFEWFNYLEYEND